MGDHNNIAKDQLYNLENSIKSLNEKIDLFKENQSDQLLFSLMDAGNIAVDIFCNIEEDDIPDTENERFLVISKRLDTSLTKAKMVISDYFASIVIGN